MEKQIHPLKALYLDLEGEIIDEKLQTMKILLGDKIRPRDMQTLKVPSDIFEKLEELRLISENDLDLLINLFENMTMPMLKSMVEEYQTTTSSEQCHTETTDYQRNMHGGAPSVKLIENIKANGQQQDKDAIHAKKDGNVPKDELAEIVKSAVKTAISDEVRRVWAQDANQTGRKNRALVEEKQTTSEGGRLKEPSPGYSVRTVDGKRGALSGEFDAPYGVFFRGDDSLAYVNTGQKNNLVIVDPDYTNGRPITIRSTFLKAFSPWDVAISDDNFLFTDRANRQVVVWSENGGLVRAFGANDDIDPRGITVHKGCTLVTDVKNHQLLKYGESGKLVKWTGNKGGADGQFRCPASVTVDRKDHVFVSDKGNNRIQVFSFEDFTFQTSFGSENLIGPQGIDVDSDGNVYVCDSGNSRIVKYDSNGKLSCFIRRCELEAPSSIAVSKLPNIKIAVSELTNNRITILSIQDHKTDQQRE